MLDIRYVQENKKDVVEALNNRNTEADIDALLNAHEERKAIILEADRLKANRNNFSKEIGSIIKSGGSADEIKEQVRKIGEEISSLDERIRDLDIKIEHFLLHIPNIPSKDVPVGNSESDNPIVRSWGEIKSFDFDPLPHWDLGSSLGLFDLERGAKIAGSGFPLYTGDGARLQRALIQFMLDVHIEDHGYMEVSPPFFCNEFAMTGTGQLPKFAEDMYTMPEDGLYAIPTAEVPVTNLYANEIINNNLPIYHVAYTPCFRREAGAAGKDTRGLQRLHQFDKVELVKFTTPENSDEEHQKLTKDAEEILKKLNLTYRVIELCTGDLGFSAAKCYDIELWSPSQNKWIEVSSCSNFKAYQARRANIRYRDGEKKVNFVHTINGSGVALPRLVIALLENNQTINGDIILPEALHPYMKDKKKLTKG